MTKRFEKQKKDDKKRLWSPQVSIEKLKQSKYSDNFLKETEILQIATFFEPQQLQNAAKVSRSNERCMGEHYI